MQQTLRPIVVAECCGVRATEIGISEIDSGKVMVTAARKDIASITLRHGTQAPHPLLQITIGVAFASLGYFPLAHYLYWMRHGGVLFDLEAFILPIPVAGIWAIFGAFKRGYFLEVEQEHGNKRFAFARKPDPVELDLFLSAVEEGYNLKIARATS